MKVKSGLVFKQIDSRVETGGWEIASFEELTHRLQGVFPEPDSMWVIAYLDYGVWLGRWEEGCFRFYSDHAFEPKYLQQLRVFNPERELLVWRQGENRYKTRLRIDGQGENTDVVEAQQVLWGTWRDDLGNGWTKLSENRGTELIIPLSGIGVDEKEKRVKIRTRNYIGYNPLGQAGYIDSRLLEIVPWGGKE